MKRIIQAIFDKDRTVDFKKAAWIRCHRWKSWSMIENLGKQHANPFLHTRVHLQLKESTYPTANHVCRLWLLFQVHLAAEFLASWWGDLKEENKWIAVWESENANSGFVKSTKSLPWSWSHDRWPVCPKNKRKKFREKSLQTTKHQTLIHKKKERS